MLLTYSSAVSSKLRLSPKIQIVKVQMMKFVILKTAVLALITSALPALAGDMEPASVRNCTWCHGASAQGYAPAPRLAGQKSQYTVNQLLSFFNHTRDNPFSKQYMWGATANLSPSMMRYLAVYFSNELAKPAEDGDRNLAATGKTLFEDGNPEANTVSCAVCHGPNAEGIRDIPRLAGLSYYYLKRKLTEWGEGYHAGAKAPMSGIASKLSSNEIEALASYLSFVK
jgi:cytochrome c553